MKILKVLSAGVLGTTLMTAYSYALAAKKSKKFEEPVLLNKLTRRIAPARWLKPGNENATGWLLHYAVGILFSIGFDQLWSKSQIRPSPKSALLLGGAAGLVGISVWKGTYMLHPNPPRDIDLKSYYGQLMVAHLIFGLFAMLGYQLPQSLIDISRENLSDDYSKQPLLNQPVQEGTQRVKSDQSEFLGRA